MYIVCVSVYYCQKGLLVTDENVLDKADEAAQSDLVAACITSIAAFPSHYKHPKYKVLHG